MSIVQETVRCIACKKDMPEFVDLPTIDDPLSMEPPMCAECVMSYDKFHEEMEREQEEVRRTGRHICPRCGERTLKKTATPTRQYGGGYDTYEKCDDATCGYAEVYV